MNKSNWIVFALAALAVVLLAIGFLWKDARPTDQPVTLPARGQGIPNISVDGPRVIYSPTPVAVGGAATSSAFYKGNVNEVQVASSHPTVSDTIAIKTDYQISFDGTNFYSYYAISQTLVAGSSYLISYTFPTIGLWGRVVVTPQASDDGGAITPTIRAWLFSGR